MKVSRSSRLNGEYQKEISEIIRTRLKDKEPALSGIISVTEADVAPDLKTAKIYISIFAKDEAEKLRSFDIISENAGFIRHELSQVMRMRTVPALTFLWDGSMAYGAKMDELFKKIHDSEEKKDGDRLKERNFVSAINNTLEEIAERIKRAKSAVILTHMRPDGDAIGSALALSRALDVLGIENSVSDESDIPSNLSFLTGTEKIGKGFFKEADLYIAVDSADEQRLGALVDDFRAVSRKKDTVNIDHHVSNTRFAKYNYVRECSANCMNIAVLVEKLGVPLDKELAQYLLLGLLTDSGNFSHDDVTGGNFSDGGEARESGGGYSLAQL